MVNEKTILLTVLAGSLFIVVIIIFIFVVGLNYRRKVIQRESDYQLRLKNNELELLRAVIETQESERQKIASNLHDEINPLLASLKLAITRQSKDLVQMGIDDSQFQKQKETINEVIDNLQSATRDLSPRILYMFGLVRAINNFLSNLEGISVNYDFQVEENVVLDDIIALNCYRIVLELIQNIRKYENASELAVFLQIEASNLKITISHNGEGITNEKFLHFSEESKGIGLNSIKSRITLLNASIDFQNRKGAEIVLAVPLKNVRED
mgnify:CR=1 FL=1|jgi:signal transduction histidine kinase